MAKVSILLLLILVTSLVLGACSKPTDNTQTGGVADSTFKELVLEVPTITCTSCRARVEASARRVPGVIEVKFDRKSIQRVTVVYDPAQTSPPAIVIAIEKNGDRVIDLPE